MDGVIEKIASIYEGYFERRQAAGECHLFRHVTLLITVCGTFGRVLALLLPHSEFFITLAVARNFICVEVKKM